MTEHLSRPLLTEGKRCVTPPAPVPATVLALVGAGRGGTTLLYKLLALHRDVAYLSNYQRRAPGWTSLARLSALIRDRHDLKLRSWFAPEGGAYFNSDRSLWRALVPTPVECEAIYTHCGIPLVPDPTAAPDAAACRRLHDAFEATRRHARARIVVTKRTANNRRIGWLQQAFGAPRLIHIVRDGRAIARSLLKVKWWPDHVMHWTGKSPRQMMAEGHDELSLAARNWVVDMQDVERGLRQVSPSQVLQIRYEDLVAEPRVHLRAIFDFIGVDPDADPQYWASVERVRLRPSSGEWGRGLDATQRQTVLEIQDATLRRWGYVGG